MLKKPAHTEQLKNNCQRKDINTNIDINPDRDINTNRDIKLKRRIVKEGDRVVLYVNSRTMKMVELQKNGIFNCKYGHFSHQDIIGKPIGRKISSRDKKKKQWAVVLENSPLIWPRVLNFRTQILYTTDIASIVLQLDVRMGQFVVEAGTGSGALSHFLSTAVAPDGHLFTFDVDKERILRAREEFAANGVGDFVSAVHRDVCKDGFPSLDQLREIENGSKLILAPRIDSVFLDLPSPWEAVKSGSSVLRKGGRMCSFSPCVEQAQKSICEMRKWSLSVTKTLSVVDTNFSCGKEFNRIFGDEVVHSGFLTLAIKT